MKIVGFDLDMLGDVVADAEPGTYVLSELMGDQWILVLRRRWYGKKFKRAVLTGDFRGVVWIGRKSNKHQLYMVQA